MLFPGQIFNLPDEAIEDFPLPVLLEEIAEVTDKRTALFIAAVVGGTQRVFVPRPSPKNWLVQLVGLEKARRICTALAPVCIGLLIPKGPSEQIIRKYRVERELREGASNAAAAIATGLHVRVIRRYRQRMLAEGRLEPMRPIKTLKTMGT
jgi:hypothetical protein